MPRIFTLIINNVKTRKAIIPGKLFEYLGSKRKIFCIGPEQGNTAKILLETKAGVTFNYSNFESMKRFLKEEIRNWQTNNWLLAEFNQIDKYSSCEQLTKLKKIFDSLVVES